MMMFFLVVSIEKERETASCGMIDWCGQMNVICAFDILAVPSKMLCVLNMFEVRNH